MTVEYKAGTLTSRSLILSCYNSISLQYFLYRSHFQSPQIRLTYCFPLPFHYTPPHHGVLEILGLRAFSRRCRHLHSNLRRPDNLAPSPIVQNTNLVLYTIGDWRPLYDLTFSCKFCAVKLTIIIVEVIGFGARGVGNKKPDILIPYIIQALLILLAPILFAASVYMILGRLIRASNAESYSLIPVKWLTKIFVGGDVMCFMIQAGGGAVLSGADSKSSRDLGQNLILAGLIIQIVVFGVFLVVAMIFDRRVHRKPTGSALDAGISLSRFMMMLYSVSFLITFRNLFRVIEYAMGCKLDISIGCCLMLTLE